MHALRIWSILGMASSSLAVGNGKSEVLDASFGEIAEALLKEHHLPGISLALIHKGEIQAKGYGFAELPSTPATPDTLWFTGSTTKAFIAAAIGKIIQGNTSIKDVKWTTPLSKLLSEDFVLDDDYATNHITIEDALSHRSGLPRHDIAYGWDNPSTTDVLRTMRYMPFTAEPRSTFQYNNVMYAAVGEAIQRLTGDSLENVLRDWIWKPLGMRSTTFNIDEASKQRDAAGNPRLSRGYHWTGKYFVPDKYINIMPIAGAGSTISSVNDYALWAKALLSAAKLDANVSSPIDHKLYQTLTTPLIIVPSPDLGALSPAYARGWIVGRLNGESIVTHSGGLVGFGTGLYLLPELDIGFVSVGNTADSSHIVNAKLFIEILQRLGVLNDETLEEGKGGLQILQQVGNTPKPDGVSKPRRNGSALPLPGDPSDYVGAYLHPAYGVFNVSLQIPSTAPAATSDTSQQPLSEAKPIFRIDPSSRTWASAFILTHDTHTSFTQQWFIKHGPVEDACGTSSPSHECRNEEALEEVPSEGTVVFELDPDGKVDRLGMPLEPELLRWAKERESWREGMIWFQKESL